MSGLELDTLPGLRSALVTAQDALLEAVEASAPRWRHIYLQSRVAERAAHPNSEWSPRFTTAHALMTQWMSTDMAADHARRARAGLAPPDLDQFRTDWWQLHERDLQEMWLEFDEHERVPGVLQDCWATFAGSLDVLEDSDLDVPWDAGQSNLRYLRTFGLEFPSPSLHTLLTLNVIHLLDHAAQMADGMAIQWGD